MAFRRDGSIIAANAYVRFGDEWRFVLDVKYAKGKATRTMVYSGDDETEKFEVDASGTWIDRDGEATKEPAILGEIFLGAEAEVTTFHHRNGLGFSTTLCYHVVDFDVDGITLCYPSTGICYEKRLSLEDGRFVDGNIGVVDVRFTGKNRDDYVAALYRLRKEEVAKNAEGDAVRERIAALSEKMVYEQKMLELVETSADDIRRRIAEVSAERHKAKIVATEEARRNVAEFEAELRKAKG